MSVIFEDGFESGDSRAWGDGGNANHVQGGGKLSFVQEDPSAVEGRYCMVAWTPGTRVSGSRRAEVTRYREPRKHADIWVREWVYIPGSFARESNEHCSVLQLHASSDADADVYASVQIMPGMELAVRRRWNYGSGVIQEWIGRDLALVSSGWHELLVHSVALKAGLVHVWWDGVKVLDWYGDCDAGSGEKYSNIQCGLYRGGSDSNVLWVAIDDVVVSTDFVPDPVPEPPPPPVVYKGCVLAFLLTSMGLASVLPSIRQLRSRLPRSLVKVYYGGSVVLMGGING